MRVGEFESVVTRARVRPLGDDTRRSRERTGVDLERLAVTKQRDQRPLSGSSSSRAGLPTLSAQGLYRDRPREDWPKAPDGSFTMFTRPLDVGALLAEAD